MITQGIALPPTGTKATARPAPALLWCGVLLGPLFYLTFLLQALARSGYDITRHPISLLSLGSAGWIQIANFVVVGLLAIGVARGTKQSLQGRDGGIWIPRLFLTFGIGMIAAGIFPPEPMLGFPPGTPNTLPPSMSVNAALHGVGFFVAFASLTVAAFIFGARVAKSPGWRIHSLCSGLLIPLLIGLGFASQHSTSVAFAAVGVVAFGWVGAASWSLLRESVSCASPRT